MTKHNWQDCNYLIISRQYKLKIDRFFRCRPNFLKRLKFFSVKCILCVRHKPLLLSSCQRGIWNSIRSQVTYAKLIVTLLAQTVSLLCCIGLCCTWKDSLFWCVLCWVASALFLRSSAETKAQKSDDHHQRPVKAYQCMSQTHSEGQPE